jgi:endoglucanase
MKSLRIIIFMCIAIFSTGLLFSEDLVLQYRCGETTEFFYKLRPFIRIVNRGAADASLSGLKARYYYTKEGFVDQKLTFDWCPISGVTGAFYDGYLEISFASGSLAPGADTGEIQIHVEKAGGGYFVQTDDYSFAPSITDWQDYDRITLYRGSTLVWGNEPPPPPAPTPPPPSSDDWLSTSGSTIRDSYGNKVKLSGINWFGFETTTNGMYNLDKVNWRGALDQMTSLGFNVLRVPLSVELVLQWRSGSDPLVSYVNGEINYDIDGVTSLVFFDLIMDYCKVVGMKVILDMHGVAKSQIEALWYTSGHPVADFNNAWQWLATRYRNDDTIIGFDLKNEPHGQGFGNNPEAAKWDGSQDAHNWKRAIENTAGIILAQNPNLLILAEGIEVYPREGYTYSDGNKDNYYFNWWGGNLRGVAQYPVSLGSRQDKLVYSPHDYGPDIYVQPWFQGTFDKARLYAECWGPNWAYIAEQNIAPILVGEWGGKLESSANKLWLESLASFIAEPRRLENPRYGQVRDREADSLEGRERQVHRPRSRGRSLESGNRHERFALLRDGNAFADIWTDD